ncbi:MAG: hypothetical protein QG604_512 [Candidatus Dependentiae bacterium]|nr:hypothetical protein [Candidatus Dependentiae bacterium]
MLYRIFWHALRATPTTLLTLTTTTATLAPIANPTAPYASLTPDPYFLNEHYDLTAPFQLRTFLDISLPSIHRNLFGLVVALPATTPEPQRLGSQIAAVLAQLDLPAYVITTDSPINRPARTLTCVFFNQPTGRRMPLLIAGLSLLLCMVTGALAWQTQVSTQRPAVANIAGLNTKRPIPRQEKIDHLVYQPIAAAVTAHQASCQLIKLIGEPKSTAVHFVTCNPAHLTIVRTMFEMATQSPWSTSTPRYQAGYPALYKAMLNANATKLIV